MELRIRLTLNNSGQLEIQALDSKALGEVEPRKRALPFDEPETFILCRALDLNGGSKVKRSFTAREAEYLRECGVLCGSPPQTGDLEISGDDIHREHLRDFMRGKLYDTLIAPLEETLNIELGSSRSPNGSAPKLHIRLEMWSNQVELFQYPWELLHGDRSLNGEIHLSRYICYKRSPGLLHPASRVRVLVLHSEPRGLAPLHLRDHEKIQTALKAAACHSAFQVEYLAQATPDMLGNALAAEKDLPAILHFAGHGEFGRRCEHCRRLHLNASEKNCEHCDHPLPEGKPMGYLAFITGEQTAHWVSAEELCGILKLGTVALVVLSACNSALGRRGEDVFNGVAQRLMDSVPAVAATPFPLDTKGAEDFARYFYESLGDGLSLTETMYRTRLRMYTPHPDEWYRPVLYLRHDQNDGGCLLDIEGIKRESGEKPASEEKPASKPRFSREFAPYFVDYKEQERDLRKLIEIHRAQENLARDQPLLCLAHGQENFEITSMLAKRFVYTLENEWLPKYDAYYKISRPKIENYSFDCGEPDDLERFKQYIADNVEECLLKAPSKQYNLSHVKKLPLSGPVVFHIHLEADGFGEQAEAYIQALLSFWGEWNNKTHLLMVWIFFNIPAAATPWRRLWKKLVSADSQNLQALLEQKQSLYSPHSETPRPFHSEPLRPLREICKSEVYNWAEWLAENHFIQTGALPCLHRRIDKIFKEHARKADRLPMETLTPHLEILLKICPK
ncbi:MAG: CHAT domain-containing protein [Gammaproteobacteria bacterium]|nr:CHAT domain-containing protein [Gammaproteobacteria bacterium]